MVANAFVFQIKKLQISIKGVRSFEIMWHSTGFVQVELCPVFVVDYGRIKKKTDEFLRLQNVMCGTYV